MFTTTDYFQLNPCGNSPYVTPSVTRKWVSLMNRLHLCQVYVSHIWHVIENDSLCIIQYRLCKADHVYLTYLMLQRQVSHLNGRTLDGRKVRPSYIFCAWIRLVI
jgi:hypothetical protein